jgi:hypothetical protein
MDMDSIQNDACRRANRNLTEQEMQRYFGGSLDRPTCPEV